MENQLNETQNNEYNSKKGKKSSDLGYGILAGLVYGILTISVIVNSSGSSASTIAFLVIYIAGILFSLYKDRGYFALGLVLIIVVPLAIVGGCLALLGGIG